MCTRSVFAENKSDSRRLLLFPRNNDIIMFKE